MKLTWKKLCLAAVIVVMNSAVNANAESVTAAERPIAVDADSLKKFLEDQPKTALLRLDAPSSQKRA